MTKEQRQNKKLIKRYPFLLPRNVFTDKIPEDYDYSYIRGIGELPKGWEKLFLQMCEDIRTPLVKAKQLETFRFTQIKEKYNQMECYNCGATEEVLDIIDKYCVMAGYVCTVCGKPATFETEGYIASYCDDCWKDLTRHSEGVWIKFESSYLIRGWHDGEEYQRLISFEDEWNRYLKSLEIK